MTTATPSPAILLRPKTYNGGPHPLLTVSTHYRRRYIAINRAGYRAMGSPERVVIIVDPTSRTIALRAPSSREEVAASFSVTQVSHTQWRVTVGRHFDACGVEVAHLTRYVPVVEGGTLTARIGEGV